MKDAIQTQAEFTANLRYDSLPYDVISSAKRIILDSIGVMAYGNTQLKHGTKNAGDCPIIGTRNQKDKMTAIFTNAVAMVKNELDEGNQFAFGHPACHIVPALLMEAKTLKSKPQEVITALVAAYETSCRWGASAKVRDGCHVHGTSQVMGAAVAVAYLRHCNAKQIEDSIILANSLPQATTWVSAFNGDELRNAYIGISNCIGLGAVDMVSMGVKSSYESLEDVWNNIMGKGVDTQGLIKGLNEDFLITKNYYKQYSACRYIHAFADMARKQNIILQGDNIDYIELETYKSAAMLTSQKTRNVFATKFSIPVSLAIYIIYGQLSAKTITEEMIQDEKVLSLASRITVTENKEFTALLPKTRKNKMIVHLTDGTIKECECVTTKGDYNNPFSDKEIYNKFDSLTDEIWTKPQQKCIVEVINDFENLKNLDRFFGLIGKDGGSHVKNRKLVCKLW